MEENNMETRFVELLTEHQSRIYAFIYSQTGEPHTAKDILQETNIILWKKAKQYDFGRPFATWAISIAKKEILMAYREKKKDSLVFSEKAMDILGKSIDESYDNIAERMQTLPKCMEKLPTEQQEIVSRRYYNGESVKDIAQTLNQTANYITVMLFRVRHLLAECIKISLRNEVLR